MTSPKLIAKLIEAVLTAPSRRLFTQDADSNGEGFCDGCGARKPIVYSSLLQWCESCWPMAAPRDRSSQPKDWASKRARQEHDYGWRTDAAAEPSGGDRV